ncbi:P-loop NTPase [candidate division KSB1 bacterium]|nr:P-loop NTPase [candidate division KSB1 bacterium]
MRNHCAAHAGSTLFATGLSQLFGGHDAAEVTAILIITTEVIVSQQQQDRTLDQELEQIELERTLADIKYKIIVLSGKGGVGKSTTAANLALALALNGKTVGLLDIDFHGPSIPKLLGLEGQKPAQANGKIIPLEYTGNLKVMSLGLLLDGGDDAVIWRGPMKMGAIKQLLKDVSWGKLDYLIVDSPPGTGDEPLSVVQLLKNPTGAVVVTQPQDLSVADVRRSVRFCEKLNLPVLGIVENMSGFICPHCNKRIDIFKSGGGEQLAKDMKLPFLGKIPLDPEMVKAGDSGEPVAYFHSKTESGKIFNEIMEQIVERIEGGTPEKVIKPDLETKTMKRYAIPTANGELCLHFGHCDQFAIIDVDVDNKKIIRTQLMTPPPHEPGVLPKWLADNNVNIILAGGMGSRALNLFLQNGIQVVSGASVGKPENVVLAHINGELETGENVCDH